MTAWELSLLLAETAIKGSVIFALAWCAARLLRRSSAATRHLIWTAACIAVLALPALMHVAPVPAGAAATDAQATWTTSAQRLMERGAAPAAFVIDAMVDAPVSIGSALLTVWAGGALIGFAALALAALSVAVMTWRARPVFEVRWLQAAAEVSRLLGLARPVRLLRSRTASMPMTWGSFQPKVLLPADSESWTEERMRAVLAHEFAHIKRNDWPLQLLAETARALYWFNPLVWTGCSRMRRESEQACDDAVLNCGIDAPDYAGHLLELARSLKPSRRASVLTLAMARHTNLERRFIAMFTPDLNRRARSGKAVLLTILAAACIIAPLTAVRASGQVSAGILSGTVSDPSGGVVPNTTIIVSNAEARTKDMTTTDAAGRFEFTGLAAGEYALEGLKPGFAKYVASAVKLEPGQPVVHNIKLAVGTISERIDVVGEGGKRAAVNAAAAAGTPQRIRVGGSMQATKMLKQVRPAYPLVAKAAGIEGAVLLEGVIARDGKLMSLRVMNSQIDPDLSRAAVEAVSQWQYQPTLLNGEPVEVITHITVNFTLAK
jgi:TonB family protein